MTNEEKASRLINTVLELSEGKQLKALELLGYALATGIVAMTNNQSNDERWRIYNNVETQMRDYFEGYLERLS